MAAPAWPSQLSAYPWIRLGPRCSRAAGGPARGASFSTFTASRWGLLGNLNQQTGGCHSSSSLSNSLAAGVRTVLMRHRCSPPVDHCDERLSLRPTPACADRERSVGLGREEREEPGALSRAEALDAAAPGDIQVREQLAGSNRADAGQRLEDAAHPELALSV